MQISNLRMVGVRCFEDTGELIFAPRCNVIVGQNNSGKSTILRGILSFQGMPFDDRDVRVPAQDSWISVRFCEIKYTDSLVQRPGSGDVARYNMTLRGAAETYVDAPSMGIGPGNQILQNTRPNHIIVPFVAKRKASGFSEAVTSQSFNPVTGTFHNLYALVDSLATTGRNAHEKYIEYSQRILGFTVTTQSSQNGKIAGVFLDDEHFIPLERMGDGVTEIVGLIAELCLSSGKIFVLEEPESNIHPKGLKSLLELIRESSDRNQFIIATHSNIVVRELSAEPDCKLFGVYRSGNSPADPSRVEEVVPTPAAHLEVLRDLGYEFADFSLFEGWLFLEESSAEQVIRDVLVPWFVPSLKGRLRTFSAAGVDKLEPTIAEFQRLMAFVHLQPIYKERFWTITDGDDAGLRAAERLSNTFPNLPSGAIRSFGQEQFEFYFPEPFKNDVAQLFTIPEKRARREAKAALLRQVLEWTAANADAAKIAWEESAREVISILKVIARQLARA